MIKIVINEARTLPVPENLVDSITRVYRAAYIKLVVDFIKNKLNNPKLKRNISEKYSDLLDKIQEKYANEYSDSQTFQFVKDIDLDTTITSGELIESIPVKQFITALGSWSGINTYLRGRMKPATFKSRLKQYFINKNIDDIQFNIEFGSRGTTSKKDYAGLYESDIDSIIVTFNASFFIPTSTEYKDRDGNPITSPPGLSVAVLSPDKIIDNIETELEETRTSVRHEIQHMFQNVMSSVLDIGGGEQPWVVGLPQKRVIKKLQPTSDENHYMIPVEMQTDIQDEIDKFTSYLNRFKEQNSSKSDIFSNATKIFLKLFIDSKLSPEEENFSKQYKLKSFINPSELFRDIKSGDKSGELYKYALRTLYTSVSSQLQESIVMNKIKIAIKESQIITEELSKEEIRKLVRDELEKMLRDKETRKEIAKITKEFVKKFYRELSFNSTHIIDQVDI